MAAGFNLVGDYVNPPDGSPQKIMAHALMGGLLAVATGSDFKTGAAAAGANEALINTLSKMVGGDQNLELMASQLTGLLAAVDVDVDINTGAEIAKNGTAFNRQLHPDEKQLAKRLAEQSNGKYTADEIEAQLRLSSVSGTDILPSTDMVSTKSGIYDSDGNWISLGDSGYYVQDFAKADKNIIQFISDNTNIYTWTPEAKFGYSKFVEVGNGSEAKDYGRDRVTGYQLDKDGGYNVPVVVDGVSYSPRFYACGNSECLAVGANIDFGDVNTLRWLRVADADALSRLSTALGYGAALVSGPLGAGVGGLSFTSGMVSGYLKNGLEGVANTASEELIFVGFEKYAVMRGIDGDAARRISSALGAAGVWGEIKKNSQEFLSDEK